MTSLPVSYAGHLSDRVADLYWGTVSVEGATLHFLPLPPSEAFRRTSAGEFQVGEMSLSTYVVRLARGDDTFVGIPVFPSRVFRHSAIYVRSDAGIEQPTDLRGRQVGVPEYQMTAALWVRGLLQHEYGVLPRDLDWVTGGLRDVGRIPLVDVSVPDVSIRHTADRTLDELLLEGGIDVIVAPQAPPSFLVGDPRVRRLFPDYREVEEQWFRKTGLFPIMHVVVVRREFLQTYPWLAMSLYRAFEMAKDNALARLAISDPPSVSLPWLDPERRRVTELMGEDFWPYGVEANRLVLDTVCGYVHEQGLSERLVDVEEMFAPSLAHMQSSRLL